jgi:hypothetical protein
MAVMVALSLMKILPIPIQLAKKDAFSEQNDSDMATFLFLITFFSASFIITLRGKGVTKVGVKRGQRSVFNG